MSELWNPDKHRLVIEFEIELHGFSEPITAVVAIHDLTLGPALGGCRVFDYASLSDARADAKRLAKAMTFKASLAGLDLGGGKTAFFNVPPDLTPVQRHALFGSFGIDLNLLGGLYIAAEDVGTTQADMDAIARETQFVVGTSRGMGDPSPHTARAIFYATVMAMEYVFKDRADELMQEYMSPPPEEGEDDRLGSLIRETLTNHKIAVQGVGKVGMGLAASFQKYGAEVFVADPDARKVNYLVENAGVTAVPEDEIHTIPNLSVFVPCAVGGVLNERTVPELSAKIVAGSANNQLENDSYAADLAARGILYIPDFVINSGGLIWVASETSDQYQDRQEAAQHLFSGVITTVCTNVLSIIRRSDDEGRLPLDIANSLASERILLERKKQLQ